MFRLQPRPSRAPPDLREDQRAALERLKDTVSAEPIVDDEATLVRFLRSRHWRVGGPQGAAAMLRRHIEWRHFCVMSGCSELAHGFSARQIAEILTPGPHAKMSVLPELTADLRPVLVLRVGEIARERVVVDELIAAYVSLLDDALSRLPAEAPGDFVSLVEVSNLPDVHPPTSLLLRLSQTLANHFPLSVHSCVMYPVLGDAAPQLLQQELAGKDPSQLFTGAVTAATVDELAASLGVPADSLPHEFAEVQLEGGTPPRDSRGDEDEAVVTTPWMPRGCVRSLVRLEDELVQFERFMLPLPLELAEVHGLRIGLQGIVRALFPAATVKFYGSFAYDLPGPTSGVDMIVTDCGSDPSGVLPSVAESLQQSGVMLVPSADSSELRGFCRSGRPCVLRFEPGDCVERRQAVWMRQQLEENPAARSVIVVLRHLLETSRLTGVQAGGVTGYCLALMVLHCCARFHAELPVRRTLSPERLLYTVLRYYGHEFDPAAGSVQAAEAELVVPREHDGDGMSVVDPVSGGNAAEGCKRVQQLRAHFQYCLSAVEAWNSQKQLRKRGCRGRTPLSSVVSHTPLWGRHDLRHQQFARSDTGSGDGRAVPAPTVFRTRQPAQLPWPAF